MSNISVAAVEPARPSVVARGVVLAVASLAYGTWRWPGYAWREWFRAQFGYPAYRGPWLTVEHVLLYTTLCAAVSAVAWSLLARRYGMDSPGEALRIPSARATLGWGVGVGLAGTALVLVFFAVLIKAGALPANAVHYRPPNGWSVLGNLFSNFYEEFIYRGLWLSALAFAFRSRWAGAVGSSIIFGLSHSQYPLMMQAMIAVCSLLFCVARYRGSLWAPYIAHQLSDMILDSLV